MTSRGSENPISLAGVKLPRSVASGFCANAFLEVRHLLHVGWGWINVQRTSRSSPKRLRVAESVSLGEKRFVAVVHVDGLQFLVGGSATSVSLLAELNTPNKFCDTIQNAMDSDAQITKRKRKPAAKRAISVEREAA
jgi:flagellar biogenesis protein FliO